MNKLIYFTLALSITLPLVRAAEEFEKKDIKGQGDPLMEKCMEDQMKSMERFKKGYSGFNSGGNGWAMMYYQQLSDRLLYQVPSQVKMTMCMLESAFGWDGETVPYSASREMVMSGMQGSATSNQSLALYGSDSFTMYSKMTVSDATADEKGSLFDSSETVRVVQAWFGPSQTAVTSGKPKVRLIYSGKAKTSRGIGVFNNDGLMNGQGEGRFLQVQTIRWDRKSDDGVQSVALQEVMQSTPGSAFQSKEGNSYAPTGGDRNFQAIANYYPADFTDSLGNAHKAGELEVSATERSSFGGSFMTMQATGIMNKVSGDGKLCMSDSTGASGSSYSRPSKCFAVTLDSEGDVSAINSEMSSSNAAAAFDGRKAFKSDYNPSPSSMSTMHQGTQYSGSNGAANTESFKPSDAGGAFAEQKFH
ncbi:MAG: hypothetical protein HYR96_09450 [Deltaproteobacteria bacterium]|nr:hypothetical protein [Deltaproteobacteria bacterium]MBI3295077.1 hypothetical protein [Deltaproteobacteria bacterium]